MKPYRSWAAGAAAGLHRAVQPLVYLYLHARLVCRCVAPRPGQ
jgi:hypothetical protein